MAGFTIPICFASTAMIARRSEAHPPSLLDPVLVTFGFPAFLFGVFIFDAYKTRLIIEGVITWEGIF